MPAARNVMRAAAQASSVVACLLATAVASQPLAQARLAPFSQAVTGTTMPAGWTPLKFNNVSPTRYTLVRDGERSVLRAEAAASASGLSFSLKMPAEEARMLRWSWKGEHLPANAATAQRATDDAVARIYVMFRYPPEKTTAAQRATDEMMQRIRVELPPHATLQYVWDNRAVVGTSTPSPYTDRVRSIVVERGTARLSRWLAYERDIAADYQAEFGDAPPSVIGVAVMTDADNTASSALAYYGDITLSAK